MAMGGTLMSLLVKLGVDTAELDTGLAGAETKAKSSASAIGSSMKTVGDKMAKTGAVMSAAVTAPIVAAGVSMVNAASDLEETRSKVGVVFGDMAGDIDEFASSAATDLGMTQEAAMAAAGTYGNLFVSMGIGTAPAADMSQGLVQLAADLASFNNMDPTMVLDKLRAGLTGETEPLKSLGVNLTAASIQAKAMEMGLADASGELSASAKAQASYALILEQTTTAQGDFARTSDGLANQQRILKAQFGDMAAELGTKLLPIALKLVEGLSGLLDWFTNLPEPVMNTILVVAGLVAALGPVLTVVGSVVSGVGSLIGFFGGLGGAVTAVGTFFTATLIPALTAAAAALGPIIATALPVIAVIAALAAVAYLVYKAWTENWGGIQEKTAELWNNIKASFETFKQAIVDASNNLVSFIKAIWEVFRPAFEGDWRQFGENLREVWDAAWAAVRQIFENAWDALKGIAQRIIDGIKAIFSIDWGQVGKNIVHGIADGLKAGLQWVIDAAENVGQAILDTVNGFFGNDSPSKVMKYVGKNLVEGFALGIENTGPVDLAMDRFNAAVATPIIQPIAAQAAMGGGATQPAAAQALNLNFNQQVTNGIDLEMVTNHIIDRIREMRR